MSVTAGDDDVPAEVPDHIDPADAPIVATPLDEDTDAGSDPDGPAELDALLAEGAL